MGTRGYYLEITSELLESVKSDIEIAESPPYEGYPTLEIDKAWHTLNFLLTGKTESDGSVLAKFIYGNEIIVDDDNAYIAYLTHSEVEQVLEAVAQISREYIYNKFDPAVLREVEIYPEWYGEENLPSEVIMNGVTFKAIVPRDFVAECYAELVTYYQEAAKNGNGILVTIT